MVSIEFLLTSLVLVLLPGTGVIYTISVGLLYGSRRSVFAAIGCTLGIIPSLLACIFGLAAIVHTSALLFQMIKFAGVLYLLYLAWNMWKETGTLSFDTNQNEKSLFDVTMKGFLLNILNPKLSLFFLAFLPQFIPAQTLSTSLSPFVSMLVLGGIFMLMTFLVFIVYGLLAHKASSYISRSPKVINYIQRTFAATFALLGAKLAFTEK